MKRVNNNYYFLVIFLLVIGVGVGVYFGLSGSSGTTSTSNQQFRIFDVTYHNTKSTYIPAEYGSYVSSAIEFWEDVLLEDTKINLDVHVTSLQDSRILAYGSMNNWRDIRAGGDVTINLNARAVNWTDVLRHEIGHAMGIGLAYKWKDAELGSNSVYYLDRNKFPETYEIYQRDYGGTEENIPLGDVAGHFDETVFTTELMTPFSNEGQRQPITDLTLSALATIGWNVDMSKAEEKN